MIPKNVDGPSHKARRLSSPTVRVEEIDGCSSATGAERGRQKTSVACTVRILSRAGVRARREGSPILCAGRTSLENCSCENLWVPVLRSPLELC